MHFTTEQGDAITIFRLKEERLDSRNAGQLKAEFLILAQPDIDALVVDLGDVMHIDSAGISALLLAQRQMKIHGGELRLVAVRPDVLSMLRLTQLDRIFRLFATIEEALAAEVLLADDEDILGNDERLEEGNELELARRHSDPSLGPVAPTVSEIRAGAIAAGGSFGAAAIAKIMMTPNDDELLTGNSLSAFSGPSMGFGPALGDDEDFADDDDDLDDDDLEEDDLDEEEDDLDEEDDAEDVVEEEEVLEDDDFEDDDFDDEELEEDEEDDL